MPQSWNSMRHGLDGFAPEGSVFRKLLQLISVVLLFEGVSVVILFSYLGLVFGVVSFFSGIILLALLAPTLEPAPGAAMPTIGVRLVDSLVHAVGGMNAIIAIGTLVIVTVISYNYTLSSRPELGDFDTLSILLGLMMMMYPFLAKKYKTEACFTLVFIALVVIFLVLPQAVSSIESRGTSSTIGTWYVHYMLAAPFSAILDLVGIDSSSSGNYVTIEFNDGSVHPLIISSYCAGLYSFSIFLAAFFSFVLVFERLPRKTTAIVLALGLAVAYLGNLFRMVIIGIVGYYYGMPALLWAHENVGWVVFLSWSAVFWYLILGYADKHSTQSGEIREAN